MLQFGARSILWIILGNSHNNSLIVGMNIPCKWEGYRNLPKLTGIVNGRAQASDRLDSKLPWPGRVENGSCFCISEGDFHGPMGVSEAVWVLKRQRIPGEGVRSFQGQAAASEPAVMWDKRCGEEVWKGKIWRAGGMRLAGHTLGNLRPFRWAQRKTSLLETKSTEMGGAATMDSMG